jgi:lipoate---protein ligase
MPPFRVYRSSAYDIFLNLALEDRLFRALPPGERALFLWRNEAAVVIGRYQNPWLECRVAEIERDRVALARRQSGGGAVWHDVGNLCFTFMGDKAAFDRKANIDLVVAALLSLGLDAVANDRLDVLVGGRKVSGSAFRESSGKSFHHGTLLVDADLAALERYLASGGPAHRAKGVKSVRSPVANLTDSAPSLTAAQVEDALATAAFAAWGMTGGPALGQGAIEDLDTDALAAEKDVAAYRERLMSRDWLFGSSPPFARRLETDSASLTLEIEGGAVRAALLEAREGSLSAVAGEVSSGLRDMEYREKEIAEALRTIVARSASVGEKGSEILAAFADAIEAGRFS